MNLRSIATSSAQQNSTKQNATVHAKGSSSSTIIANNTEIVSQKRRDAAVSNQQVRVAVSFCQM